MCNTHYTKAWKQGFQLEMEFTPIHRLANVDVDAKTAVCEACGPVAIRIRKGGRRGECMTARRKYVNRIPTRAARRNSRLRMKYGIDTVEYDRMYACQGGLCAICQTEYQLLHVDHDHQTGMVRGLLCNGCNTGIGHLGDSPETLRAAADYLAARKSITL